MVAVRNQTWSDNLRLPCFINAADTTPLLTEVEGYRKPAIPFQSKHLPALKRNQWWALQRPADRSRTGFLCIWPQQQCCVYISGEALTPKRPTPRVALLRLRVDPQFLTPAAGLTVFAASLSGAARRLWIEDVLVWKGRHVFADEPFSKRILMATQWLEHYCILDARLLDGLEIELAGWRALNELKPDGAWELMEADEAGRRRLLWIANHAPAVVETPAPVAVAVPKLEGPLIAVASKESGPDQWGLVSADGVSLGRALIRRLETSAAMRALKTSPVRVEVTWNPTFSKWEIARVSSGTAVHSSIFAASK